MLWDPVAGQLDASADGVDASFTLQAHLSLMDAGRRPANVSCRTAASQLRVTWLHCAW